MSHKYNRSERIILIILRLFGVGGLLAIPPIFFPYAWMNDIHAFMGLGTLPDVPIVSYLARCLSAFYAVFGALGVYVSLDIRKNRSFVKLVGVNLTVLGLTILGIDVTAGMPWHWTLSEGPFTICAGLIVLANHRHISEGTSESEAS